MHEKYIPLTETQGRIKESQLNVQLAYETSRNKGKCDTRLNNKEEAESNSFGVSVILP